MEKSKQITAAKDLLESNGFFVENLWCVDDVKGKFECNDDEAQDVLSRALQNECTMEQIWLSIDIFAEMDNLTRK